MPPALVVYDSSCGPCARFKGAVDILDVFGRLDFIPIARADEEGRLVALPPVLRYRSFHIILPNGEIRSGATALLELIGQLPAGRLLSRLVTGIPSGTSLLAMLYSMASRLHASGSCRPPA